MTKTHPKNRRFGYARVSTYGHAQPPQLVAFELFERAAILLKPFDHIEFHDVKILDDL
jgi:hypothetical protein